MEACIKCDELKKENKRLLMREAELEGMLKYEEIKKAHKRGLHHPREHRYNYYLNLEQ